MTRHIGIHGQIALHDFVQDFDPSLDVRIKNARRFPLPRMDLGIEEISHQINPALRDIDGEIASAVTGALGGDLKRQSAEIKRHASVKSEIGPDELFSFIGGITRLTRLATLLKLLRLLHEKILRLVLRRDIDWLVLTKMPPASRMISGGVGRDKIPHFLVRELADRSQSLIRSADIKVKDQHAFVGDDEGRVARAGRVLHEVNALGDLLHIHLDLRRGDTRQQNDQNDERSSCEVFHDLSSFAEPSTPNIFAISSVRRARSTIGLSISCPPKEIEPSPLAFASSNAL